MSFNKNKSFRLFIQLFRELIFFLPKLAGSIIPTKSTFWVFGHQHGYTDNAKLLFEYIRFTDENVTPIWLFNASENPSDYPDGSVYKYSIKGIYIQLRAKVFFISTGMQDVGAFVPYFNRDIYVLWHGWPIKKILLHSPESYPSHNSLIKKATIILYRLQMAKYRAIFCHDEEMSKLFISAFQVNEKKCVVTGWPRLDKSYFQQIEKKRVSRKKQIFYAPTWHSDKAITINNLKNIYSLPMIRYLEKNGISLIIKLHPLDRDLECSISLHHKNITFTKKPAQSLIEVSDVFISDYSSLIIDAYLLKNVQVILFGSNLNQYIIERGIYDDFLTIYQNHFINNTNGLIQQLKSNYQLSVPQIKTCENSLENIHNYVVASSCSFRPSLK